MFAVRWNNEIIAEKCSIITGGYVSKVIVKSPHSLKTQIVLAVIFYITEFVADTLTVLFMDKWYGVPFLRLPRESNLWTKKYWLELLLISMIMVSATLEFYFAYETTRGLSPDVIEGGENTTYPTDVSADVECDLMQTCTDVCSGYTPLFAESCS